MKNDFRKCDDFPQMVKITKIVDESPTAKTFFLDCGMNCEPGRFIMLWMPGIDEKPFALSYLGKQVGTTAVLRGKFTQALFKLKPGDMLGVRGPYGRGFSIKKGQKALVVAGGIGVTEVMTLIEELKKPTVILGAKTKDELVFEKKIRKHAKELYVTTDDGSKGIKGYTTDVMADLLKKEKFEVCYTCGPEIMMTKVLGLCNKYRIDLQASLERYMKCGFGICGECALDDSLVCLDGPVYYKDEINKLTEFGKFARLKSGRKVTLQEYFAGHG